MATPPLGVSGAKQEIQEIGQEEIGQDEQEKQDSEKTRQSEFDSENPEYPVNPVELPENPVPPVENSPDTVGDRNAAAEPHLQSIPDASLAHAMRSLHGDNQNRRISETGDFTPSIVGHTPDKYELRINASPRRFGSARLRD